MKMLFFIIPMLLILQTWSVIRVRNGRLVDKQGGQLIFHGINVVQKVAPYYSQFGEKDLLYLQRLGINGIRLGVMWPGVEPERGEYNQTYLNHMRKMVDNASAYGIYTLVEFHQDLLSEKFCADGVPVWAIPHQVSKGFPRPVQLKEYKFDDKGFPDNRNCSQHSWSNYYFSEAVARGFGALWNNHYNLRDMFIAYWKQVAATFKSSEYVIAYQLANQPWPGNQFENPLIMVPGLSEKFNLQHAYDIISKGIREVDPDHNICFEPVTWLNQFPAGFTHPPGGKKYVNSSIFCYHYYKPPSLNLDKFMKARMADVKKLGTGGLLSQFYIEGAQGESNTAMMDKCDQHLQSWFGWYYHPEDQNITRHQQSQSNLGEILFHPDFQSKMIKGIVRVYAPRVAGETVSQKYNKQTRKFTLVYYICKNCGDTTIFVSEEFIYKAGFVVECYPTGKVECVRNGVFLIRVRGTNNIEDGSKVMVTVSPL